MQGIMTNPLFNKLDPQKKFKLIEDEGTKWLSAYPGQHKSPEGLAVRYELAHALFMQDAGAVEDTQRSADAGSPGLVESGAKTFHRHRRE